MFLSRHRQAGSEEEALAAALLQTVQQLLDAIDAHPVKGQASDHEELHRTVQQFRQNLAGSIAAAEVNALAERTAQAIQEYNGSTSQFIEGQRSELEATVATLTRTILTILAEREDSARRLKEVESQLVSAAILQNAQAARERISASVKALQDEAVRERTQAALHARALETMRQEAQERAAAHSNREMRTDPLTGLPLRADAEAALFHALKDGRPAYAAVFVVERLDLINSRFGHDVGDQVLLFFREHVAQALTTSDRLFRWTGPALVGVLDRPAAAAQLGQELSRLIAPRLSKAVTVGHRQVLLPVNSAWAIFAVQETRPLERLVRFIDGFVESGGLDSNAAVG